MRIVIVDTIGEIEFAGSDEAGQEGMHRCGLRRSDRRPRTKRLPLCTCQLHDRRRYIPVTTTRIRRTFSTAAVNPRRVFSLGCSVVPPSRRRMGPCRCMRRRPMATAARRRFRWWRVVHLRVLIERVGRRFASTTAPLWGTRTPSALTCHFEIIEVKTHEMVWENDVFDR